MNEFEENLSKWTAQNKSSSVFVPEEGRVDIKF